MKFTKETVDEFGKKCLHEIIEKGGKPTVVAGFIDFFGDATITACSKCGVPVFVRPWLFEAIIEHGWKVVCICCADSKDVKGQLAMDLAKMENTYKQ